MPPKGTSGVYQITNMVTGDSYIGSSNDIRRRWKEHCQRLVRGRHDNAHLQRSWLKYGADAFTIIVLEVCAADALIVAEQRHMDAGQPSYNMAKVAGRGPGMAGKKHSEATLEKLRQVVFTEERRAKMSAAIRDAWTPDRRQSQRHYVANLQTAESREKNRLARVGHPTSEETREKISAAKRGKPGRIPSEGEREKRSASMKLVAALRPPISQETRKKMADAVRGKARGPLAAETREKIRRASTGRKHSPETREKIRQNNRARPPVSEETRARMSAANRGRLHTDEARAKIGASQRGRPKSDEHRRRLSEATKRYFAAHQDGIALDSDKLLTVD